MLCHNKLACFIREQKYIFSLTILSWGTSLFLIFFSFEKKTFLKNMVSKIEEQERIGFIKLF